MDLLNKNKRFLKRQYGISNSDLLVVRNKLSGLGRPYDYDDITRAIAEIGVKTAVNEPRDLAVDEAANFTEFAKETGSSRATKSALAIKGKIYSSGREREGD